MNQTQADAFKRDVLRYAREEANKRGITDDVNVTVSCQITKTETHDMHEEAEQ